MRLKPKLSKMEIVTLLAELITAFFICRWFYFSVTGYSCTNIGEEKKHINSSILMNIAFVSKMGWDRRGDLDLERVVDTLVELKLI